MIEQPENQLSGSGSPTTQALSHDLAILISAVCGGDTRTMTPLLDAINRLRDADISAAAADALRSLPPASVEVDDWRILRDRKWDWHDANLVVRPYVDALIARLAAAEAEVARIQHDFADDLADRRGDLYEQIKDLVTQFHVERDERAELRAEVARLTQARDTPLRDPLAGLAEAFERRLDQFEPEPEVLTTAKAALAAEGALGPLPPWQPLATCPRDMEVIFWLVPKTAEESYTDSAGQPIVVNHAPYWKRGRWLSWGALSKPTHWMPLPSAPERSK